MGLYFLQLLVPGFLLLNPYSFIFLLLLGIVMVCLGFCGFFSFSWIFIFSVMSYIILSDCINHIVSPEVNNILSSYVLFNPEESLYMWIHRYTLTIFCGAGTYIYQMLSRKEWENSFWIHSSWISSVELTLKVTENFKVNSALYFEEIMKCL